MKQDSKKNKLNPNEMKEDKTNILRPKKLDDFIGQDLIKSNLKTFIDSSVKSKKNLELSWKDIRPPSALGQNKSFCFLFA